MKHFILSNSKGEIVRTYKNRAKAEDICHILNRWYFEYINHVPGAQCQPNYYTMREC